MAGQRAHGSTAVRPFEVFTTAEEPVLLPLPAGYDIPVLREVKVHRDFHVEIGKDLYSVPGHLIGQTFSARADTTQVKLFHRGQLVKIHRRQGPGGRVTDPADLPDEQSGYAMRDLERLVTTAAGHGVNIGTYAQRLLGGALPWTRMRAIYRLLGLVRRYGPGPVDTACGTALDLDVIAVGKIDAMLAKALENTIPAMPLVASDGRFARDPSEYRQRPDPINSGGATSAAGPR